MQTYIALLRGINVGGRNVLRMADLKTLLAGLGLSNLKTYIQSGNVVFQGEGQDVEELGWRISAEIARQHGFEPRVLVIQLEALKTAIASNPFPGAQSEPKSLHFFFLSSEPQEPDLGALEELKKESERFALVGNVFYLHAPEGIGRSKLATGVEKALGVPVTARNWRTVSRIMDMATGSS